MLLAPDGVHGDTSRCHDQGVEDLFDVRYHLHGVDAKIVNNPMPFMFRTPGGLVLLFAYHRLWVLTPGTLGTC